MVFKEEKIVEKECEFCKKQFTTISKNPKRIKYCSKKCKDNKWREEHRDSERERVLKYNKNHRKERSEYALKWKEDKENST